MPLSPRKHDKLNNPKHAAVTLDSFLGLLSSAYGTEELDSSIIFDRDSVNWTNISVENLRAIPKKDNIGNKVKKEKGKENIKLNAATSTSNLRPTNTEGGETDETLYSIKSLVNLHQIKSKLDDCVNGEPTTIQQVNSDEGAVTDTPLTESAKPPDENMDNSIAVEENIDNSKELIPVCGFYVDDCDHKVIFDIQFVKKETTQNDIMPVFEIGDPEVLIHITDTMKSMKSSMKVSKSNLVSKVQYFAEVDKEFGLENLDVFVKCNFGVFQWVLQWIMSDIPMCKPHLNFTNFKAIMSMANQLVITQLIEECLYFFRQNFTEVLDTDKDTEEVFDDKLLLKLTKLFSNSEIEQMSNDYQGLKTKLFCTLIKILAEPDPCKEIGHFSSLSTIFQCGFCQKVIQINMKDFIPCRTDCTHLTFDGKLEFHHECSSYWNISRFIEGMYEALSDWRSVYWQLWGMCHFFYCEICQYWYPMNQSDWCLYHPGGVEYFPMTNSLHYPFGTYSCCGEKTFKFDTVKPHSGCKYKSHVAKLDTVEKVEIFNIHQEFKHLINISPPEVPNIKKFVKLVKQTDESSVSQNEAPGGKYWWEGIVIAPEEKKDYSLIPQKVLNILRNKHEEKKNSKTHVPLNAGNPVHMGIICPPAVPLSANSSNGEFPSDTRLAQTSKRCRPKLAVKKGKPSNIFFGSKAGIKKKKSLSYVYQPVDAVWTDLESNKDNQDNQRDFEEIAMRKLVEILTPEDNMGLSQGSSAGSYIRLETEWWQRNCGSNMDKTSSTVVNRTFPLSWFRRLTI